MGATRSKLLFVGLNPPTTSGTRTRGRVGLARKILGFTSVEFSNLFAYPTRDALGLAEIGGIQEGWLAARKDLSLGIGVASAVLLGYGMQTPRGAARVHFRAQVNWLEQELQAIGLPVWLVGDAPRHPSRWQRHTCRLAPGVPFEDALRAALAPRGPVTAGLENPGPAMRSVSRSEQP